MKIAISILELIPRFFYDLYARLKPYYKWLPWIILAFLPFILIEPIRYFWRKRKEKKDKLKKYYKVVWKKGSELKPEEILEQRGNKERYGFNEYYHKRECDELIKDKIINNQNVLITGNPLAGKTRSIYQALLELKSHKVLIPEVGDIKPEDFLIPPLRGKGVLFLDDLNKFVGKQNFEYLISEFLKRKIPIIATCRSGPEYEQIWKKLEEKLSLTFGDPIEIPKVSREEGEKIAKETGKDELPESFDGTIGSIFLPLVVMSNRFKSLQPEERGILLSLKRLHLAGIYRERDIYSTERVKLVCQKKDGIEGKPYQWQEWFKNLEKNGFIELMGDEECRVEEAYLERVVEEKIDPVENFFKEMTAIFVNDPEALVNVGVQAYIAGKILRKPGYLKIAVSAFKKALKVYTPEKFPYEYALTQYNLGTAYGTLAEVENKRENCTKAINAYNQAFEVYTIEKYPYDYAGTQNNLGNAYLTLAEVENKRGNCIKAINAFNEALKVFTIEKYPYEYATTQYNLGSAYHTLAKVEDKRENCRRAYKAYKEALEICKRLSLTGLQQMAEHNIKALSQFCKGELDLPG
ncbi:MAG: tetratricopeptide repeat protein [Acidobacteria bacterium]|nr:tetratricopeptide repeat protein [Acidobacteriota bacterium]